MIKQEFKEVCPRYIQDISENATFQMKKTSYPSSEKLLKRNFPGILSILFKKKTGD